MQNKYIVAEKTAPFSVASVSHELKDWIPWDPPARQQKKTKKKCRKKIASLFFNESLGYFAVICDGFVKFDIYFS